MPNPAIGTHASQGGKAAARRKLTLDRVERELGALETVDDAMRRLDKLNIWITAGMLTGSAGGAAVRAIEIWLRSAESKLTREVVEDLRREVNRIKVELKGRPAR